MSIENSRPDEREQQLDAIIAAYYRAVEAGECIDQKDFIAKYPEVQTELSEFFADLGMFNAASPQDQLDPALEPTLTSGAAGREESCSGAVVRYFGEYEILEELGAGGMGVVYKARQSKLTRIVAIKMIRSGELANSKDLQRFEAEARAAAKLSHPGIVSVHEVGIHNGQHFYTMDYVDGGSVAQLLRNEPVPPIRAAKLVRRLAEAMHYAHEQNIVHRDLKPANILLTAKGAPRITDFGLAKHVRTEAESNSPTMTETGQILGTAGYMSPEQAAGKSRMVGPSADIYSLGAVLYALLTRRAPFVGETPSDTILRVLQQEPLSPRKIDAGVPRDLETICLKCLEKEPHKRYGTAHMLARDLQLFLDGKPVKAHPVSSLEHGWRWCRRNSVLTALLGLILLVTLCSPILVWYQVMTIVDGVQDARGAALPELISDLQKYPTTLVTQVLNRRFENEFEAHRKLNLAFALVAYGTAKSEYLVSQVGAVQEDDTRILFEGLKIDRNASLKFLHSAIVNSTHDKNWKRKSQLAILTLHLGDPGPAVDMCQITNRPDPVQRTLFIDEFPRWHINTESLSEITRRFPDDGFCSATILAMASVPKERLTSDERHVWRKLAEEWYVLRKDAVTHSSLELLLRRWNLALPKTAEGVERNNDADWYVNTAGQTFLRVPAGSIPHMVSNQKLPRIYIFSEPFWMSDREVSVGQFQQFINDPNCPASKKPADWPGAEKALSPTPDHPVQNTNWWDAVLYCNWLSHREGLTPAYQTTGETLQLGGRPFQLWQLRPDAEGYRLPVDIEWEYACRAGTTTLYSSGNDEELLRAYSPYHARRPAVCGSHRPNAWGFFDMHGNIAEIAGSSHVNLMSRGGAFNYSAENQRVDYRVGYGTSYRSNLCGFRLVRGRPANTPLESLQSFALTHLVRPSPNLKQLTSRPLIESEQCHNGVQHSAVSPLALYGGHDRLSRIIDLRDQKEVRVFPGHSKAIWSVALSPDCRHAVTGSEDRTLRLWDVATGKELDRFSSDGIFSCVRFSKDGKTILATNWDQKVRRYKVANNELGTPTKFTFAFASLDVALLPDEKHFVFGTVAGSVFLCDMDTGVIKKTFEGHSGWVHSVAILGGGRQILSASHDSTVRLWNVETSKTERVYLGHSDKINEIRILPSEKYFLSCGEDKTLRLWDIASGRELARGTGKGELRALSIAPDGKSCLTAGMPGALWEWTLPATAELEALSISPHIREMRSADSHQQDYDIKRKLSLRITDVFISIDSPTNQPLFAIEWGPADGTDFIIRHRMLDEDLVREEASALQLGFVRAKVKTVTINGINRHIGLWTKAAAPSP